MKWWDKKALGVRGDTVGLLGASQREEIGIRCCSLNSAFYSMGCLAIIY